MDRKAEAPVGSSPAQSAADRAYAAVLSRLAEKQRKLAIATDLIIDALIEAEKRDLTGSAALHYMLGRIAGTSERFDELNALLARIG